VPIPGQLEPPHVRASGCGFAGRCAHVEVARCTTAPIALAPFAPDHRVACVRATELPVYARRRVDGAATPASAAAAPVVATEHLTKVYVPRRRLFGRRRWPVRALNDVGLAAARRQTLAIVGESGCGKSTLAKILVGIEVATEGRVTLDGAEIGALGIDRRGRALKRKVQMVFQNPESTLNPSHTVGYAIGRALRRLRDDRPADTAGAVARLLETVKLSPEMAARVPRQLSGGEKQRVAIARALAGDPDVVVADEPVSALDVSVQAAIINLLNELQAAHGTTLLFISHDLSVVRYLADHVAVMYLGSVLEYGRVEQVFAPPYHPYTEALLSAVPVPDPERAGARIVLDGAIPRAREAPRGCPFASRCPRKVGAVCDDTPPPVQRLDGEHRIACHIPAAELAALQV